MTQPRKRLVSVSDTPYYHIVTRCVRRAFLCGKDPYTKHCYEHRRGWLVERIKLLSTVFAIDICAYAVLSNHYHLVIKLDPGQAANWDTKDLIRRWRLLYRGHPLIQRFECGENLTSPELAAVNEITETYRKRLCDLSWFAKCLNEPIAREANKEDNCTGKFWEARFTSQALLDETALLTAMAYVDLNPIRAGMATSPEDSDFTSIQERIVLRTKSHKSKDQQGAVQNRGNDSFPVKLLVAFMGATKLEKQDGLPCSFDDYLELVDWTGRAIRDAKCGYISSHLPPILQRLNANGDEWVSNCRQFEVRYFSIVGRIRRVQQYIRGNARKWCRGQHTLERMFTSAASTG